jgi:hypothetical protein
VFKSFAWKGPRGSILWGRTTGEAATLGAWRVTRGEGTAWQLAATLEKVDSYRLKQVPLFFLAPRLNYPRGTCCFPVVPGTLTIDRGTLFATLQHPEGW